MSTLIEEIQNTSSIVETPRTPLSVLSKVMEEVGELAQEVAINSGVSYKQPGKDGVLGEAVDAIIAIIDLVYVVNNTITEDDLIEVAQLKLAKWKKSI